jgi:hypothetical protein
LITIGDGLHDHELPALDALGDGDFAFACQQRHRAHLSQVHAHGIVCFFQRAGRQIQIALALVRVFLGRHVPIARLGRYFHRARRFRRGLVLVNLNSIPLKGCEEVVDLF